jgi:hypothetical protein
MMRKLICRLGALATILAAMLAGLVAGARPAQAFGICLAYPDPPLILDWTHPVLEIGDIDDCPE